jgi:hypothetical protein
MKKILLLIPIILLTGCLAVTKAPPFPELPKEITEQCPELKEAEKSPELSKLLDTVVQNYGTYYECRVKVEAVIEWHKRQKEIYEKAVK